MNDPGKPKAGLLPLMMEMYKEFMPEMEKKQSGFVQKVASMLGEQMEVQAAPIVCTKAEIRKAVHDFERDEVDLIVVLFVSYTPSAQVLPALLETRIPLLLFSTSPKRSMAEGMTMDDIMLNHGVHGYMDLANVLRRSGKDYRFTAGVLDDARPYREIGLWAGAARVRNLLGDSRVGIAGYTFDGMGDIALDPTFLNARLGPETVHVPLDLFGKCVKDVDEKRVIEENKRDRSRFDFEDAVDDEVLSISNRLYLGLADLVEDRALNAFTMHFQAVLQNPEIKTPPFYGITKLQEAGLAYAGEGDVLGAVGNLMLRYMFGDTIFTETFCPDFEGGRIVMGHMGESNPAFGVRTLVRRKNFVFGESKDPVVCDVEMEEGEATVLNLGLVEDNRLQMVAYTGEVCGRIPGSNDIDMPYFHFKPHMELDGFLEEYGRTGGTHHIGMTRGNRKEELVRLAEIMQIDIIVLD